jgi:hypothetical protein
MNNDIVPELLDKIQKRFNTLFRDNKKIVKIQSKIDKGTATYLDAQTYAIEVGEILAKSFEEYIVVDVLPDGRMYYNIAERILTSTLGNNHNLISTATLQIQDVLNSKAGLGLKGVEVPFYQNKVMSIVNRISNEENFEDIAWILNEPVVTFSQNVVDEILKANVEFQAKSGMRPTITRIVHGHDPCDWCLSLAGTYEYPDVPRDVYKRHDRCKCSVNYDPGENKKQNVWTKEWITEEEREQIEFRKTYGL